MSMSDRAHSRFDCLAGHTDHGPLAAEAGVRWSWPLLRDSLHGLLEGSPFEVREHFETGHTNFQPEWR